MNWNGFEGRTEDEGGRRRGRGARPGGWQNVDLPPADAHTSSHRVDVRTSELATTGLVSDCWVP